MTVTYTAAGRARSCAPDRPRGASGPALAAAAALFGALAGAASPGLAGSPAPDTLRLLPAEFESYAAERTLVYRDRAGVAIGAERHLPGNRVIWSDPDGRCVQGVWRVEQGAACFYYSDDPLTPVCWSMERRAEGMVARLIDATATLELLVEATELPLQCDVKDPAV